MNTAELIDQLSIAVHRDAARGRRRQRLAATAAVVMLFVVGGVGIAGTYDNWWAGAEPAVQPQQLGELARENAPAGIDLDLTQKATVARTDDAALVAVATNKGKGYCMSLFLDGATGLGSSCTTVSDSEYLSRADDSHWIGYGRILDEGAAAVDLSGAGLPAKVPLARGGFFLFDIPRRQWRSLDGRSGDISILDANGATIRRTCVYVGSAPGGPYAGGGGLGDKPGTCASLKPIVPDPELDRATRLVSLTLARPYASYAAGTTISLWRAANRGGGTCWLLVPGSASPGDGRQAMCGSGGSSGLDRPTVRIGDGLASGWVPAGSRIVRIAINGSDAAMANGAFIAQVGDGPWQVVSYDSTGQEVASVRMPG